MVRFANETTCASHIRTKLVFITMVHLWSSCVCEFADFRRYELRYGHVRMPLVRHVFLDIMCTYYYMHISQSHQDIYSHVSTRSHIGRAIKWPGNCESVRTCTRTSVCVQVCELVRCAPTMWNPPQLRSRLNPKHNTLADAMSSQQTHTNSNTIQYKCFMILRIGSACRFL